MTLTSSPLRFLAGGFIIAAVTSCASNPSPSTASAPSAAQGGPVGAPHYLKEFGTMWTFEAPPLEYWKQTYNFTPDSAWLNHVRLASIRLPNCSSSFVSANGLVMTNHHCGRRCTSAVAPKDSDYMKTGFAALTPADEKKCTGLYVDQLISIANVTGQIQGAVTGQTTAEQSNQIHAAIAKVEQECHKETGLQCQVITLYNGGMYSLYRFKRYTDLRLVMAPEESIAFYGGDPDNFTYPRYDLDITLLRVYENDKPLQVKDYLRWSPKGADEGDLVFVTGNPGSTGRLNTLAQMEYLRDVQYPASIAAFNRNIAALRALAVRHGMREFENDIFGLENSKKATVGYRVGLVDSSIMARKRRFEADFRARVSANEQLRSQYGDAWEQIAGAEHQLAMIAPYQQAATFGSNTQALNSALLTMAAQLVRIPVETPKPEAERFQAYREPTLSRIMTFLKRDEKLDLDDEKICLVALFRGMQEALPSSDAFLQKALQGKSPEAMADYLIQNTKLGSVAARQALLDGGVTATKASTDPMIELARLIDSVQRKNNPIADSLNATILANTAKLGRAIFAVYGTTLPPDATFSLRITDGVVKGFPMNGTIAPYKTSFYGLFARAAEFNNKDPFELPTRWAERRDRIDLKTPFDIVTTNDIIGGNSGSPVINRNGEVVGLIFDGNIESLPNRFIFTDEVARSVAVDSRGITEALRKVYDLNRIADELEGK